MLNYGWQSDRDMWERISKDLLEDASWRNVGFTEIDAVSVPKGQSGIYMLCASPVGYRFPPPPSSGDLFANLLTQSTSAGLPTSTNGFCAIAAIRRQRSAQRDFASRGQ